MKCTHFAYKSAAIASAHIIPQIFGLDVVPLLKRGNGNRVIQLPFAEKMVLARHNGGKNLGSKRKVDAAICLVQQVLQMLI
jgi:hypothetical protein